MDTCSAKIFFAQMHISVIMSYPTLPPTISGAAWLHVFPSVESWQPWITKRCSSTSKPPQFRFFGGSMWFDVVRNVMVSDVSEFGAIAPIRTLMILRVAMLNVWQRRPQTWSMPVSSAWGHETLHLFAFHRTLKSSRELGLRVFKVKLGWDQLGR